MAPAADRFPDYTIKRSSRARHVRITVTAKDGLVVTLPAKAPTALAENAVARRAAWITKHLDAVADRAEAYINVPSSLLPREVHLGLVDQRMAVEYREEGLRSRARSEKSALIVTGPADDARRLEALRSWRDRQAHSLIPPLAEEAADAAGVRYSRLRLALQKSRWGSCSAKRTLSLNRNLIFLPHDLVRHVIAHEVVHLTHLDHSPAFHARLESMDGEAASNRKLMRSAWQYVPPWAEP